MSVGQGEQVALVGDEPAVEQRDGALPAQRLDIERAARGRGGTAARAAAPGRRARWGSGCRSRPLPWRSGVPQAGHSRGNTNARSSPSRSAVTGPTISGITSPALRRTTMSPISTPLRLTSYSLCSVALLHGRAAHLDRPHHPERGHPPGPPDVDPDVEQPWRHLFRRVLVRDRPARRAAGRAQRAAAASSVVDLDHHAVDLIRDSCRCSPLVVDERLHAGEVGDDPVRSLTAAPTPGAARTSPTGYPGPPPGGRPPRTARPRSARSTRPTPLRPDADAVQHRVQGAGGRDPWILLPQRARPRCCAGWRTGLAGLDQRPLSSLEGATGKNTSPRTSSTLGHVAPGQPIGHVWIVRTFGVTSSPVRPSPRVAHAPAVRPRRPG